jgi:hypothetical protein
VAWCWGNCRLFRECSVAAHGGTGARNRCGSAIFMADWTLWRTRKNVGSESLDDEMVVLVALKREQHSMLENE